MGGIVYIDYPSFEGLKGTWVILVNTPYQAWIFLFSISFILALIPYLLSKKVEKETKDLSVGDPIVYKGNEGKVISETDNENRLKIEIEVPRMSLSKLKNK